jgi:nicotinic acid mononucleotide adenylyltransferase
MAEIQQNQDTGMFGKIRGSHRSPTRLGAVAKMVVGPAVLAVTYISCGVGGLQSELTDKVELSNPAIDSMVSKCGTPLASGLLHFPKSLASVEYFDICDAPSRSSVLAVSEASGLQERLKIVSSQKIESFITPPGITLIRKRQNVTKVRSKINGDAGAMLDDVQVILNIVTRDESSGNSSAAASQSGSIPVVSIDVWSGQEALVALMDGGTLSLGTTSSDTSIGRGLKVEVLVNGWLPGKMEQWQHWIPAWGFDFESKIPFKKITGPGASAEGTIEVAAKYSNYELGSRTSMGALFRNWKNPAAPKVGLHFGTFDPPHEGHIDLSRHVLEREGFSESILLPNYTAGHKPGASPVQDRVAMTVARVQDVSPSRIEDRMNVFVGDSSFLMKEFGVGALFARIGALFATDQVWSLIGDDAWDGGILPSGILQPGMIMRYMIFPRGDRDLQSIHVPEYVKDNAKLVVIPNRKDLSSTLIRRKLVNGEPVPAEMMSPAVVRYIQERPHLYR